MSAEPTLANLCQIIKEVSLLVIPKCSRDITKEIKDDGSPVTIIDRRIQQELLKRLSQLWPMFGFVGEEMTLFDQIKGCQSSTEGYWVLDPLDGTTNFASGFHFYGISLALVKNGEPCLAVIYDPIRDECFSAEKGRGAFLNGCRLDGQDGNQLSDCIANVDYKRLVGELAAQLVRCPPYRSQRNLGASVLEWGWLAAGRFQLYLHGGQKLWDFCAGYLILKESGGASTSLSGLPFDFGNLRKRSVVAAVNPTLLVKWVDWINMNTASPQSPVM